MRIRSIRPEFWSSEDIAAMDWTTRLVFIGLWSYVDDNGVGRDVEKLIVADLFPLEDDPRDTLATVSRSLARLSEGGQITRYTLEGRPYLHINAWSKHQRIDKAAKSRYPLPTSDNAEPRETVATPSRDTLDISPLGEGEKRRRGEGEKTTTRDRGSRPGDSPEFTRFWDAYPRKTNKGDARTAWAKAIKRATVDVIQLAVVAYANDPNLPADQTKIPHASTWLNGDRWEDGPQPAPHAGNGRPTATDRMRSAWELSQQLEAEEQHQMEIGS